MSPEKFVSVKAITRFGFETVFSNNQKMENVTGRRMKYLQKGNGTEYLNKELDAFLSKNVIQRRLTVSYCPQTNGISERKNRTFLNLRCLTI